jgi:hypothetical protein
MEMSGYRFFPQEVKEAVLLTSNNDPFNNSVADWTEGG